jgi:hypothetical protein
LGFFVCRDPFPGNTTGPQSLNGFAYANGNPVGFVDPSGLLTFGACINFSIGIILYSSVSFCPLVVATNFKNAAEVGATFTTGKGYVTGGTLGLSFGPQIGNGDRVSDLGGPFKSAGGSFKQLPVPTLSADYAQGHNAQGQLIRVLSFATGVGQDMTFPLPVEAHVQDMDTGYRSIDLLAVIRWISGDASSPGVSARDSPK